MIDRRSSWLLGKSSMAIANAYGQDLIRLKSIFLNGLPAVCLSH